MTEQGVIAEQFAEQDRTARALADAGLDVLVERIVCSRSGHGLQTDAGTRDNLRREYGALLLTVAEMIVAAKEGA